jgi:hypothetical protein
MTYNGNDKIDEVEYRLNCLQRKEDANAIMKNSSKIMNGERVLRNCDEVVGISKKVKQK